MRRITDVIMCCPKCKWVGLVGETEPDFDDDGNLGCPECGNIVEEVPKELYDPKRGSED